MLDVTPSIRNFAQAIDRQRQAVERIPLLDGAGDVTAAAQSLDEAEAAALAISWGPGFPAAARAVNIPVLRADAISEEFRIYESRAAGADAVLLKQAPAELLKRLVQAATSTHMAACVLCATADDLAAAVAARAPVIAVESLELKPPPRTLVLAMRPDLPDLRGRADAVIDPSLSDPDAFRRSLEEPASPATGGARTRGAPEEET